MEIAVTLLLLAGLWLFVAILRSIASPLVFTEDPAASKRRFEQLLERAESLAHLGQEGWIRKSAVRDWLASQNAVPLPDDRTLAVMRQNLGTVAAGRLDMALRGLRDPWAVADAHNANWVTATLTTDKRFFDRVLPRPLHPSQRRAVVMNDDHNIILAAAGTGKTATLVARIAWLVRKQKVRPRHILAMAYNKKAAEELQERLTEKKLSGVKVSTFHALGKSILDYRRRRKASVSELAKDDEARHRFVADQLHSLLNSPDRNNDVLLWFASYCLDDGQPPPKTYSEYLQREYARDRRTLTGQMLRSSQEVYIANWLTLNGIEWEYERQYDLIEQRYRPDFYLPDYYLWLEHWGVSRDGKALPGLDVNAYQRQIQWKRERHREHGTTLLETWTEDISPRSVDRVLTDLLSKHEVEFRRLSSEDIQSLMSEGLGSANRFARLLSQFLILCRGRNASMEDLRKRASSQRDHVFLNLFEPVLGAWEEHLQDADEIDFDDMLIKAAASIREGRFTPPWTHVLVDELQDTSVTRLELVEAIRDASPGCRVVGVGDDWQSIYRFAGADVNLFTGLRKRWDNPPVAALEQTWRMAEPANAICTSFIQKNPAQLRKTLLSRPDSSQDPVTIVWTAKGNHDESLALIFDEICQRNPGCHVRVLARYNHWLKDPAVVAAMKDARGRGLTVHGSTIHRAKGLECDHAIVLGVDGGPMGFPSTIEDDPVLRLVLSQETPFPFAEERRLFYVALTRARLSTWLLVRDVHPSPFVEEILQDCPDESFIDEYGEPATLYECPQCEEESICEKHGQHGAFWSCRHYPVCDGKLTTCPQCREAPLVPQPVSADGSLICPNCEHKVQGCPRCRKGHLVERVGPYGAFVGCSQWRRDSSGCGYTRSGRL